MKQLIVIALFAFACGSKADEDDGPAGPGAPPDVTGRYNVQISGATGCEGESFWLVEWVPGALTITGKPGNLSFDWGGDIVLSGSVDGNKNFSFEGDVHVILEVAEDTGTTTEEADLAIFNSGTFTKEGDCWELAGTFEVVVDEDGFKATNCTLSGPVRGYQLDDGGDCNGIL